MYCMHAQERASGSPRTHFRACKSQFSGGIPPDPPHKIHIAGPNFCICPGPPILSVALMGACSISQDISIPLLSPIEPQVLIGGKAQIALIGCIIFFVIVLTSIPIHMIYHFLYMGFSLQDLCGHKAEKAITNSKGIRRCPPPSLYFALQLYLLQGSLSSLYLPQTLHMQLKIYH